MTAVRQKLIQSWPPHNIMQYHNLIWMELHSPLTQNLVGTPRVWGYLEATISWYANKLWTTIEWRGRYALKIDVSRNMLYYCVLKLYSVSAEKLYSRISLWREFCELIQAFSHNALRWKLRIAWILRRYDWESQGSLQEKCWLQCGTYSPKFRPNWYLHIRWNSTSLVLTSVTDMQMQWCNRTKMTTVSNG